MPNPFKRKYWKRPTLFFPVCRPEPSHMLHLDTKEFGAQKLVLIYCVQVKFITIEEWKNKYCETIKNPIQPFLKRKIIITPLFKSIHFINRMC